MQKDYNTDYFNSISKDAPKRRYALWIVDSPGWGCSIFNSLWKAIHKHDDKSLVELYESFPLEAEWFDKHLQNDPGCAEIIINLFKNERN